MHPDEQFGDSLNNEMFGDPNKVHEPIVAKQYTQAEVELLVKRKIDQVKKEVKIGCITLVRIEPQGIHPTFYGIQCGKGRGIILPGGKWEQGKETFLQCAKRELYEETGVVATDYKLVFGGMSEEGYYTYAFTAQFTRRETHDDKEGRVVVATWDDLQKSAFAGYYGLLKHAAVYSAYVSD